MMMMMMMMRMMICMWYCVLLFCCSHSFLLITSCKKFNANHLEAYAYCDGRNGESPVAEDALVTGAAAATVFTRTAAAAISAPGVGGTCGMHGGAFPWPNLRRLWR